MFASILASLQLLAQIFEQAKSLYAFYQANQTEKWFQDSMKVLSELTKPGRTEAEKKQAIIDLAKSWGGL